ncbi:hypothetical protein ACFLZB_03000 [Nanoarchaeota archaeon]
MAKKRGKKKPVKKKKTVKKPTKKKHKNDIISIASLILGGISAIVLLTYVIASFIAGYNLSLTVFSYLAVMVILVIAIFGIGLASVDLADRPKNKLSKKAFYLNIFLIFLTLILLILRFF